jgi:DNA polymerase III epsilon subunit family exonuclease
MTRSHKAAMIMTATILFAMPGRVVAETPGPRTRIGNANLVVLDVETTGYSPRNERVVEIGAVRIRGGEIVAATNWLVNPGRPIPEVVIDVHGISDAMVAEAPSFADIAPDLKEWFEDALLIAHNATFDMGFLAHEFDRNRVAQPDVLYIDSLRLFRRWFPDSPSHQISALMTYLGLEADTYHRAELDARYTAQILLHGLEDRPRIRTLGNLIRQAGDARTFGLR